MNSSHHKISVMYARSSRGRVEASFWHLSSNNEQPYSKADIRKISVMYARSSCGVMRPPSGT
jgi:hypothetical protein